MIEFACAVYDIQLDKENSPCSWRQYIPQEVRAVYTDLCIKSYTPHPHVLYIPCSLPGILIVHLVKDFEFYLKLSSRMFMNHRLHPWVTSTISDRVWNNKWL